MYPENDVRRTEGILRVLLISTYELGRQPFGVASAASWLSAAGSEVSCRDLAVEKLDEEEVKLAELVAFYVPMHTATRIAINLIPRVKELNPHAHLCFFGLYAPVNEQYLRKLGVGTVLGGEFEEGLVSLAGRLARSAHGANGSGHGTNGGRPGQPEPVISLGRQQFLVPERTGLPLLPVYAKVDLGNGEQRIAGATEATRGCLHRCRHCPIVPVYDGRFRVVQSDVVLSDVRQQVARGAQHITFGDPDFFNAPRHALEIVRALHDEFPAVTYDVTIKVQHLKKRLSMLPVLKDTGCLFVTSAVEAVDETTLLAYEKFHTRQDFIDVALEFRRIGLTFNPTFVAFSPWTTLESYADLLNLLSELDLVDNVAQIQLAIRLLIPRGSRLLELTEVKEIIGEFDEAALYYPWQHPDPRVDQLHQAVLERVQRGAEAGASRRAVFAEVRALVRDALPAGSPLRAALSAELDAPAAPRRVPALTEAWYCCAEPTEAQLRGAGAAKV
jgi:Radical SAM superfamily